jgi:hypothetical protein
MARLLWNPAVDVNREIDDFMSAVYGPAAPSMRRYFDRLHREVRLPPAGEGRHIWIFNLPEFSPAFLSDAAKLFNQALDDARDPAIRRRIERARLPVEYVELINAREYRIQDGRFMPGDLQGWQRRFHAFADRLRAFGVQSIREGRTIEEDEKVADTMRAHAVLPLENDRWRLAITPSLSGRIIRMISSGSDLLRTPRPGESGYPDLAGEIVQAFPDFPLRAWPIEWKPAGSAMNETALEGACPNGLSLRRSIRLEGEWVRTRVVARNTSAVPLDVVLQSRAEFDPGDIDAARVLYRTRGGAAVDRPVLTPGDPPNGAETRKEDNVPDGEWTLQRAGLPPVVSRFRTNLTQRTTLNWTAKGGARVSFGVWSRKRVLAPGDTLELEASYR